MNKSDGERKKVNINEKGLNNKMSKRNYPEESIKVREQEKGQNGSVWCPRGEMWCLKIFPSWFGLSKYTRQEWPSVTIWLPNRIGVPGRCAGINYQAPREIKNRPVKLWIDSWLFRKEWYLDNANVVFEQDPYSKKSLTKSLAVVQCWTCFQRLASWSFDLAKYQNKILFTWLISIGICLPVSEIGLARTLDLIHEHV